MWLWLVPGWVEAHPMELMQNYAVYPRDLIEHNSEEIRKAYSVATNDPKVHAANEVVISFPAAGSENYEIIITKLQQYSPTLIEELKLVRRTMFSVELVTERCDLHGIPERIGLLYEVERKQFGVIDNQELHERIVKPVTSPTADYSNEEKLYLSLYFSTAMRRDEIINLKVGDVDMKRRTIGLR